MILARVFGPRLYRHVAETTSRPRYACSPCLFDLASDRRETTDVAGAQPDAGGRLSEQLDRRLKEWAKWGSERAELADDERREIERHLEDLGYI